MVVSLALLEYGLGEERQRHPVRLGHAAADERKAAAAARGAAASARTAAAAKTRELRLVDSLTQASFNLVRSVIDLCVRDRGRTVTAVNHGQ